MIAETIAKMTRASALIVVSCWDTNDYLALQLLANKYSAVTFVVVPIGDYVHEKAPGVSVLTWETDAIAKYLTVNQISSFPHCIVVDEDEKVIQSYALAVPKPCVDDTVDYFAIGIESYNNFDIFNATRW